MEGTGPVLQAAAPRWPVWVAGGLAAAAAATAAAAHGLALPGAPLDVARTPAVLSGVSAAVAVGFGAVAVRSGRPRGPWTTLGRSPTFPWPAVRMRQEDRLHHVHCVGANGSGRTAAVLAPMLQQDLAAGAGLAVIEIRGGDLCTQARGWAERLDRPTTLWEPGRPESACWNPLSSTTPGAADRMVAALGCLGGPGPEGSDHFTGVGANTLRHAVAAFANAGQPLDLERLRSFLTDPAFRHAIMARVGDPDLLAFFRSVFDAWGPDERRRCLEPILTPLDALLASPFIRRALCPPPGAPVIDLARCLCEGRVVLVRLPLGDQLRLAAALGGLLLSGFAAAAATRADNEAPFYLYLDEFQNFCGPGFAEFLAEARDRRVGMVLGHGSLGQLRQAGGDGLEQAVLAHTRTTVLLRCDREDADRLAAQLPERARRRWAPEHLAGLPFGLGVTRLATGRHPRAGAVRLRSVAR